MTSRENSDRAARFWNRRHLDPVGEAHDNFLGHPMIQTYMSLRAFGSMVSQIDTIRLEIARRTEPGAKILSVGCGRAEKERWFAERLPDREFVAIDIADEILDEAREINQREGVENLRLEIGDFNALELERSSFDLVLGLGAIHHVEALENFWDAVGRSLVPGGVVVAQEFIGADRLQWTDAQLEHCNRAIEEIVPAEHKAHHEVVVAPDLQAMIDTDPSEAVRSSEILTTARAAGFDIDGFCSGGGALLQPILMFQIASYDPRNWQHNLVLSKLFAEEDRLMREGVLDDDFAMFVAIPPGS